MRSQKWPRFKYFCEFLNIFLGRLGVWPLPRLQRGEQRAAIGPRHAGQVGCDWRTDDHVTTILPCDWLQGGGGGQVRWHAGGADRAEDGAQVGCVHWTLLYCLVTGLLSGQIIGSKS